MRPRPSVLKDECMHEHRRRRTLLLAGFLACCWGCAEAQPQAQRGPDPTSLRSNHFDPATSGSIRGRVFWEGELPDIPAFTIKRHPLTGFALPEPMSYPNPNAPNIDPKA